MSRFRFVQVSIGLLAVLAVAAGVGCKKKYPTLEEMKEENRKAMAPILEKHRAASTAKIEALKAVAKEAQSAGAVKKAEALQGSITIPENKDDLERNGILVANVEWAVAADGSNGAPIKYKTDLPIHILTRALADGHAFEGGYSPQGVDEEFGKLENMKQAALVRIRDYKQPKVVNVAGELRFEGAKAVGDVLVYDLDSKKRIGAFPYEAVQGAKARISKGAGEETARKDLENYFTFDFVRAVQNELSAYASGKAGPAAPGVAEVSSTAAFAKKIKEQVGSEYFLAKPTSVDIEPGENGKFLVTIHAETPNALATKNGVAIPGVVAAVEKVLGAKADVKVVKADK